MREFPLPVGLGGYGGAEGAAEDLVTEADSCEADVGAVRPDVSDKVHEPMYPRIVAVCIPTTPRNQNRMNIISNLLRIRYLAAVRLNDVLHRRLDA